MMGEYFYHEHIRRAVSVFGTLFNNIDVVKYDGAGKVMSRAKAPLSYGPTQKFLSRINEEESLTDPKLAIRLPRMSFEITSISIDQNTKLQRSLKKKEFCYVDDTEDGKTSSRMVYYPIPYRIGFQLSIIAKHMDDALQILEQILPYFRPEYTVTVHEVDSNFKSDMPFILQSVSMSDDYEGDYVTRRSIIYTLDFQTIVKIYGPIQKSSIIKEVNIAIADMNMKASGDPYRTMDIRVIPPDASEDDPHSIVTVYDAFVPPFYRLETDEFTGTPEVGMYVAGLTSMASGIITKIEADSVTISVPDENFVIGETVMNADGDVYFEVTGAEKIWTALKS
jgi:hypothetical protein